MNWLRRVAVVGVGVGLLAGTARCNAAQTAAATIVSKTTDVGGGVRIHYISAGEGPAILLLHGFAQNSRMWRPLIPQLAAKHTVIAPDLPGIGESSIAADGYDMNTAAKRIHALVKSLGVQQAEVVGHDIGLMVAYAYAAQFPSETTKLVLMDAFLPGVQGWEPIYNSPNYWHFRFYGATPEALVKGRERTYFGFFWNDLAADKTHSLPTADREAYIAAYSQPGRMAAAWQYFAGFPKTAEEFAELAKTKLTMPVLTIGGDKSLGLALGEQGKAVANDVQSVIVTNSGHWVLEEQPKQTTDALLKFL